MKKCLLIVMPVVLSLLLTACSCEHEWVNATCTTPVTCLKCGEVAGEALGHQWIEANCITAKTCSICNVTNGEALGHKWANASCTESQKCSVCGETGSKATGHKWTNATCITPKKCSVCGSTEGGAVGSEGRSTRAGAPGAELGKAPGMPKVSSLSLDTTLEGGTAGDSESWR